MTNTVSQGFNTTSSNQDLEGFQPGSIFSEKFNISLDILSEQHIFVNFFITANYLPNISRNCFQAEKSGFFPELKNFASLYNQKPELNQTMSAEYQLQELSTVIRKDLHHLLFSLHCRVRE